MRLPSKMTAVLALLLLAPSAASAATLSLQIMNGKIPVANTVVVAYMSHARVEGVTNASGQVTLDVPRGAYLWLEVNGQRVNQLYREGQITAPIDLSVVGFMTWMGGKKS